MIQISSSIAQGRFYAELTRPQNAIYPALLSIIAYSTLGGNILSWTNTQLYLLSLALYALAASYNNLTDLNIDRANKRADNPLTEKSNMSSRGVNQIFFLSIASTCVSLQFLLEQPATLICTVLATLIFVAYSHPRTRLKTHGLWGIIALALYYSFIPIILGAAQIAPLTLTTFVCAGIISCLSAASLLAKDYKDRYGDALHGIGTPLVRYGAKRVQLLALTAYILGSCAAISIFTHITTIALLLLYGLAVTLIHRRHKNISLARQRLAQITLITLCAILLQSNPL